MEELHKKLESAYSLNEEKVKEMAMSSAIETVKASMEETAKDAAQKAVGIF